MGICIRRQEAFNSWSEKVNGNFTDIERSSNIMSFHLISFYYKVDEMLEELNSSL